MLQERGLRALPMQNPGFLRPFQSTGFQNPVFLLSFRSDFGLAKACLDRRPGCRFSRKTCKNQGFGNMGEKKHVKTRGSALGNRQNLAFHSIFLSLSKTSMDFSWCICLPGGLPGPLPSQARKWLFSYGNCIGQAQFSES